MRWMWVEQKLVAYAKLTNVFPLTRKGRVVSPLKVMAPAAAPKLPVKVWRLSAVWRMWMDLPETRARGRMKLIRKDFMFLELIWMVCVKVKKEDSKG